MVLGLPVLHADTAGIDIGATEIYVAVPADRDEEPVRCFGSFTDRSAQACRVAAAVRHSKGRDGIDRGLLDPLVADPGG